MATRPTGGRIKSETLTPLAFQARACVACRREKSEVLRTRHKAIGLSCPTLIPELSIRPLLLSSSLLILKKG